MKRIVASFFLSLDGVMEAPEKWHFPYFNDEMGQAVEDHLAGADTMLMGRRTYEEFSGAFAGRTADDDPIAGRINATPKYVVSTTMTAPDWENSTLIGGDVVEAVTRLKQGPGAAIAMSGSATLVRTLLSAGLVDELRLLVHPIVVGAGARLFEESAQIPLRLVESRAFATGVLHLTYAPEA
ncbi:dihydrofolate reductase family protein [Sphaerisporangium sp. B11E5]|uniref:dihydrofolate reductase family protein n=1 Tax=Sphaerisporangium sp. B11E5 TaxID=3153563 RepID=UPI00325DB00D